MELLPLKEIAEALGFLREQQQMMIDDVYQRDHRHVGHYQGIVRAE